MTIYDKCNTEHDCMSQMCHLFTGSSLQVCTQTCVLDIADSCPMGYDCLADAAGTPICWPHDKSSGGGCCSTSRGGAAQASLLALALAVLLRRKRR